MNRILFAVFVFMTCLTSYAQKLNNRGQKMVSSVDVIKYGISNRVEEHTIVSYEYNSNCELIKMVKELTYDGNKRKEIFEKVNGNLVSKIFINGKQTKKYKSLYEINEYGFIKRKITQYAIDNDSVRKITDYHYDDEMRLVQVKRWQKVKKDGIWYSGNDAYYYNFGYINNNCYWNRMWSSCFNRTGKVEFYNNEIKYDKCSYGDINNDTNVNLNLFIYVGMCWKICLDVHDYEMSSEWCPLQASNIINYSDGYNVDVVRNNKGI